MNTFKVGVPRESTVMPDSQDGVLRITVPEGMDDLLIVESPTGQKVGITFMEEGNLNIGTWNHEGEWVELRDIAGDFDLGSFSESVLGRD